MNRFNLDSNDYVYHTDEFYAAATRKKTENLSHYFSGEAHLGNIPNCVLIQGTPHIIIGACHAALGGYWAWNKKGAPAEAVLLHLGRYKSFKDVSEKYFDMILAEDSPWSELWDRKGTPRIHYNSNGTRVAVEIDVTDKTPSQLLMNFAIATRFPYEGTTYSSWDKLNQIDNLKIIDELGIEGTRRRLCALFALGDYEQHKKDYVVLRSVREFCHHPLSIDFGRNFLNGTPNYDPSLLYSKFCVYYPCNAIWDSGSSIIQLIKEGCMSQIFVQRNSHFKVTLEQLDTNQSKITKVTKKDFANVINSLQA